MKGTINFILMGDGWCGFYDQAQSDLVLNDVWITGPILQSWPGPNTINIEPTSQNIRLRLVETWTVGLTTTPVFPNYTSSQKVVTSILPKNWIHLVVKFILFFYVFEI